MRVVTRRSAAVEPSTEVARRHAPPIDSDGTLKAPTRVTSLTPVKSEMMRGPAEIHDVNLTRHAIKPCIVRVHTSRGPPSDDPNAKVLLNSEG